MKFSRFRQFFIDEDKGILVARIFVVVALAFGVAMTVVVPPFQAPDENYHYAKAYAATEFEFVPLYRDGAPPAENEETWESIGFYLPKNVIHFMEISVLTTPNTPDAHFDYQGVFGQSYEEQGEAFYSTRGITPHAPVMHIPQIIGIAIGKLVGASCVVQYYQARAFNLFCYVLVCFFALTLFPFKKWAAMLFALNPMALFLAASTSGDALLIALSFLFISFVVRLCTKERVSPRQMVASWVVVLLLVLMKPVMIILCLLYFLIPNRALSIKRKAVYGLAIFVSTIGFYLAWSALMPPSAIIFRDFADPAAQVGYLLTHPLQFLKMLVLQFVFGRAMDASIISFSGNFGWLDTPVGLLWILAFWILVLIAALYQNGRDAFLEKGQRVTAAITLALLSLAVFVSLYIIWNPVGSLAIAGVQGRYFIPFCLVALLLFTGKNKLLNVSEKGIAKVSLIGIALVLCVSVAGISFRYGFFL